MRSEWSEHLLEELCTEITVGYVGSMTKEYQESGIPFFRSKNIREYEIDWTDIKYVSREFHNKLQKSALKPGDVAVVRTGKPGIACVIPHDVKEANCSDLIIIRVNPERLSAHFLCFYMNSVANHQISSRLVGAVQQHFNVGAAKKIVVKAPNLEGQTQIVKVLKDLSDKIQLNQQVNQTLEQMAQAIFKSWFVYFEPVKAKIAALEAGGSEENALLAAMQAISGKDAATLARMQTEHPDKYAKLRTNAELFPSAMQDSELGLIPVGWYCLALDEIAKYQNGLALQKFRPENENDYLPVVKIAQLKKGNADGAEKASPAIKPECIIENGDVVFSWSGSLMVDTWCGGKAALNQHLFKVTSNKYPKWLYFQFTRHHLNDFQRIAADKAVTMGHIKREHLHRAKCAIPDKHLIENAGPSLQSILEKQIELRLEVNTLTKLRDTLLPKLLSGELALSIYESEVA